MAPLTKLKKPIQALPAVVLLLLAALAVLVVQSSVTAEPAQVWAGRAAELADPAGRVPGFVAAQGDAPLPVYISLGEAGVALGDGVLEVAWPAGQSGAERPLLAFNAQQERLYLLDPLSGELYTADIAGGAVERAGVAAAFAPRSLAVDGPGDWLYLLDASGAGLFSLPASATGVISPTLVANLPALGLAPAEALALNPADGRLYLLSLEAQTLYQLSTAGELLDSFAIPRAVPAAAIAMAFAPSQDATDAPETQALYLIGEMRAYEWWPRLTPDVVADTINAQLIRNTLTSNYSPSSPDPSGLAFLPAMDLLVMTDSEVDETDISDYHSVFMIRRAGSVSGSSDLTAVTDEPTGVAYNPTANTFFYSDDDPPPTIYEVNRPPNQTATPADVVGSYAIGGDPEGLAFDDANRRLFIVDGVDRELRILTRTDSDGGPFLASGATHTPTSHDLETFGLGDPESVEYDPITDRLFILDSVAPYLLYEFELTDGLSVVNTYNIAAASPIKPAGLTIAAPSTGISGRSFYIVDRGLDSGSTVTHNDGRLYELCCVYVPPPPPTDTAAPPTLTATSTIAPPTPTITATATSTVAPPTATATQPPVPEERIIYFAILSASNGAYGEENDSCSQAYPLQLNSSYTFLPEDQRDWYQFSTGTAGRIVVSVTNFAPLVGQVAIYRGESCGQAGVLQNVGDDGPTKTVDLGDQPAGNYYVFVGNDGPLMDQPYQLIIEFTANN